MSMRPTRNVVEQNFAKISCQARVSGLRGWSFRPQGAESPATPESLARRSEVSGHIGVSGQEVQSLRPEIKNSRSDPKIVVKTMCNATR